MDITYLADAMCSEMSGSSVLVLDISNASNFLPVLALSIHLGVKIAVIENDRVGAREAAIMSVDQRRGQNVRSHT